MLAARSVGARMLAVAERRPQTVAIGTSAPCVVAGDALAQQIELKFDGKQMGRLDARRTASVLGWSVWYLGVAQYRIYLHLVDPVITADRFGRLMPLIKSAACNLIVTPFVNIPLYYAWSTTRLPYESWSLRASLEALQGEWVTSSLSGMALWGPAQWVNFAVVPTSMRIPFMSGVAFVWSLVISLQASYGNIRPSSKGLH